jgi:hypothetical protein
MRMCIMGNRPIAILQAMGLAFMTSWVFMRGQRGAGRVHQRMEAL